MVWKKQKSYRWVKFERSYIYKYSAIFFLVDQVGRAWPPFTGLMFDCAQIGVLAHQPKESCCLDCVFWVTVASVRSPLGPVWGPRLSSDWWSAAVKVDLLQRSPVSGPLPRRPLRPLSPLSLQLECWVRPLPVGVTCRLQQLDKFSFWSGLYRKNNLPGVALLRRYQITVCQQQEYN